MSAAATDKFRKLSRRWVGQIGSGGVSDAVVTTIPLASATNLATDTGVTVVIDRVDANGTATPSAEETVVGVVSGSNLVNCVRGVEGTAQAHDAGAVVEVLVTASGYNDMIDGFLVSHAQDGTHAASIALTTPKITTSINDANGNEVIKTPATASAVNEITVTNAATGNGVSITATGGDTNIDLTVSGKGTGVVKTTSQELTSPTFVGSVTGWITSSDTWVYASASTFTIAGVDRTTTYTKGTRLKWNEGATVKYGVVVLSAFSTNTTVTIAVNADYAITETTLSAAAYSYQASPQGYPTWFNYTPTLNAGAAELSAFTTAKFSVIGNMCQFYFDAQSKAVTGSAGYISVSLPITGIINAYHTPCIIFDGAAWVMTHCAVTDTVMQIYKTMAAGNWVANETGIYITTNFAYII